MDKELIALKGKMSNLSNDALFKILHVDFADYRDEAIAIVKEELQKRNIDISQPTVNTQDKDSKPDVLQMTTEYGTEEDAFLPEDAITRDLRAEKTIEKVWSMQKEFDYDELQPEDTEFNLDMLGLQSTYEALYKAWLQDKPQQAFQDLLDLGQYVYQQGINKASDFIRTMKEYLGEMWEKYKPYILDVWQETKRLMKSEEGAVINPFYKLTPTEQELVNYLSSLGKMPTEEQYQKIQERLKLTDKGLERVKNAVGSTGAKGYKAGGKEGVEEKKECTEIHKAEFARQQANNSQNKTAIDQSRLANPQSGDKLTGKLSNCSGELSKKVNKKYFSGSAIARIIAVIFLLWALDRHAYGYYKFLRWVVCGASVYTGVIAIEQENKSWGYTLGIIALLFNPIIPFHLDRDTWHVINVVAAIILGISTFIIKENNNSAT